MARSNFDHDLARWMRRAGLPLDLIARSLKVRPQSVANVTRNVKPATSLAKLASTERFVFANQQRAADRLAWCPIEMRSTYAKWRRCYGARLAREMIQIDLKKVSV